MWTLTLSKFLHYRQNFASIYYFRNIFKNLFREFSDIEMNNRRVLSIQSHVVSGYVGNKSATFPLQVMLSMIFFQARYLLFRCYNN